MSILLPSARVAATRAPLIARLSTSARVCTADLFPKLKAERMAAMRSKNSARAGVIRSLISDYQYAQKNSQIAGKDPESIDLLSVIHKALVRRQDASAQFRAGNRTDLAETEEAEAKVIQEFLPQPLTEEEISKVVQEVLAETGIDPKAKGAFGKIMGAVSQKVDKVRAPSKIVSALVKGVVDA